MLDWHVDSFEKPFLKMKHIIMIMLVFNKNFLLGLLRAILYKLIVREWKEFGLSSQTQSNSEKIVSVI